MREIPVQYIETMDNNTYSIITLALLLVLITYKKMISKDDYEYYKKNDVENLKYNSFVKKSRQLYKKSNKNKKLNYNKNHISIFISSVY